MSRTVLLAIVLLAGLPTRLQPPGAACQSVWFSHELSAKEPFEKAIGGGLIFRLFPTGLGPKGELNGWHMEIVSVQGLRNDFISHDDFIYPVNLPLRFNGTQIFGANYNDDTRASLSYPHVVRFLLRRKDFDRLSTPLENALWPYNAPNPDRAGPDYLDLLKTVATGQLVVKVLSYATEPGTDSLRRMRFRAEFTVPQDFQFAPEFKTKRVTCYPDS